jgi:hypothetical protein
VSANNFASVRVVGGLLPPDLLARIISGDPSLGGLTSSDYHLSSGESPREAANRAWAYLLGAWTTYKQALQKLPEGDPAVGLTRERWLTLLFKELDFGRLQQTPPGGLVIDDKSFPVSHLWGATPMHLLGWGVDLDKRTKGVAGAAERAPQAMLQEALNRTSDHLWAILANGKTVRLLRDSTSLAGQAYVEFDLETMFDGEIFSDFVVLYLLLHQSRVEVPTDGSPADCWLEKWRANAAESGTRALGLLRDGVKEAIEALGTGFLQTPGNDLNARLADGSLRIDDYHRSLLRLVYRLLFLFVAEDRGLLFDPESDATERERYRVYFSTTRLRLLARKRRGSRHTDLWQALELVMTALGNEGGRPELGLVGLGGIFNHELIDVVTGQHLPNQALLAAVRKLSVVHPKGSPPRVVDYRNLGAEELGSIYESLLELIPRHDQLARTFTLEALAGNERKTSGSYYTPSRLIDLVLDEALDPILDEREKVKDPERALLSMTVCDPACGSGHFLVAAARRIATRLAAVRTDESDPTPTDVQAALHDVVTKCLYGVDLNPMAVELAKVSLWLEAMQPGRPLSFLDGHIKVGNALLGTSPKLLENGLPDSAFVALTGDDRKWVSALKKRNKTERDHSGQEALFEASRLAVDTHALASRLRELDEHVPTSLDDVQQIERRYREFEANPEYTNARLVADGWCAAFVCPKVPDSPVITQGVIEQLQRDPRGDLPVRDAIHQCAVDFRFFHWFIEFPQVFSGPEAGFTCLLGNPPWEMLQLEEQEFFASRSPEIEAAPTAARRKSLIRELLESDSPLAREYLVALRKVEAEVSLVRNSGGHPLTAQGKLNTYSLFAESFARHVGPSGIAGLIVPSGLATDSSTSEFFSSLVSAKRLQSFSDFENRRPLFEGVDSRFRFSVVAIGGVDRTADRVPLAFMLQDPAEVSARRMYLDDDQVRLLNPNTGNLPVFGSVRDADLVLDAYGRFPILVRDSDPEANPWALSFRQGLFNLTADSSKFRTEEWLVAHGAEFDGWRWTAREDEWLPLYEGKMLWILDHRAADIVRSPTAVQRQSQSAPLSEQAKNDPNREPRAMYWVSRGDVDDAVPESARSSFNLGWRGVTSSTNERTFVPTCFPKSAVGNNELLVLGPHDETLICLMALWSSLAFDFVARQKLGSTQANQFIIKQLACPSPAQLDSWCAKSLKGGRESLMAAVLELSYTSWRLEAMSASCGLAGAPFVWDADRRAEIRAELDATIFHLYQWTRDDVDYVLGTFDVLRRSEDRDFGDFRTQRLVLRFYDLMADAFATGVPYVTAIDPPPGFGPRHDPSTRPDWLKETS